MNAVGSDESTSATKPRTSLDLDQAQEFWVREADRWDGTSGRFGDAMLEAADLEPGQRVLDVGCGAGSTSPVRRSRSLASVPLHPAWMASTSSRRMPRCIHSRLRPSMP
jgi:hypothetical protein